MEASTEKHPHTSPRSGDKEVDDSYSGTELFGVGIPAVLGVGLIVLGIVLMLVWRLTGHDEYFGRNTETVDPEHLSPVPVVVVPAA